MSLRNRLERWLADRAGRHVLVVKTWSRDRVDACTWRVDV